MNLLIRHVPEGVVERLKERAARNGRSLQDELLHIVEMAAAKPRGVDAYAVLAAVRRSGLNTPSESVRIIRQDRDGR